MLLYRFTAFFVACIVFTVMPVVALGAGKPNIIIIIADDIGYSDLGCYGGEIETPHLDKLAYGGIRFTQFYNSARCCPTRASLLTGLHPHQAGMGYMTTDHRLPGYRGELSANAVTIAEALRSENYRNYCVGKWHVTSQTQPDSSKHNWPLQRGFDRYYGIIYGGANFFDPACLARDNTMISAFADPEYKPDEYYFTHAVSDHAVRFVKEHHAQTPDQPFFMYVAHTAAHWPMHAPEEAIAKYKGKYDAGYTPIREARYARMLEMGLIDERWQLSPQPQEWETITDKAWESRCMEVYAAMITEMDMGIGQLVDALKETGQYENTVIMYLNDNGACAEGLGRQENGKKVHPDTPEFEPLPPEAVFSTELFIFTRTRDGFALRNGVGTMPGARDTFIAYGRNWANVSNTPFREYKHRMHEGGISTPLIVHAPSKITEAMRGKFYREPGQLVDLLATCINLAGAKYPQQYNDNDIQPLEGISLVPAFSGEPLERTKPLFWEHTGNRAIRDGKWKLVAMGASGLWELYDMEADRSEMNDLSVKHREIAENLAVQWENWANEANVFPWPWATYERNFRIQRTLNEIKEVVPTSMSKQVEWKYTLDAPPENWFLNGFDDSDWKTGKSGFGNGGLRGNPPIGTAWTTNDIWLRREFELPVKPEGELFLYVYYDESPEIWINGVLAAKTSGFSAGYVALVITPEAAATLQPGKNRFAVKASQTWGGQYIDVGLVQEITPTEKVDH